MYKRILVPVDGSPTSKLGLEHAAGLAKPLGAAIRLINVVDELSVIPAVDAAALVALTTLIDAERCCAPLQCRCCSCVAGMTIENRRSASVT